MKGFKQFIAELRSTEHALRNLQRIRRSDPYEKAKYGDDPYYEPQMIPTRGYDAEKSNDALIAYEKWKNKRPGNVRKYTTVKNVRLASLRATQQKTNATADSKLAQKTQIGDEPHMLVAKHNGEHWILNGHHHYVALRAADHEHADVHYLNLDKEH